MTVIVHLVINVDEFPSGYKGKMQIRFFHEKVQKTRVKLHCSDFLT
jgi:hypothetical protein